MNPHKCIVPGCENLTTTRLCGDHWFKLPIELRQEWWEVTNYGKLAPPPELIEKIKQAHADRVANESTANG